MGKMTRGKEIVNICRKYIQTFVIDEFLGRATGGGDEKYGTHSETSSRILCFI